MNKNEFIRAIANNAGITLEKKPAPLTMRL